MFFLYQFLLFIIILLSPIIIIIRLLKKKEDKSRFIEKFCFFTKKRKKGKLVWIHAASVGELQSIIPIIYEIEKNKKLKTILVTTSTLSSSKVFKNYKFKKVIHQFFPIDFFYYTAKFLKYWNPSMVIFVDSEVWPSMFKKLGEKSVPLLLVNARITPKSFRRWYLFNKFSKNIFHHLHSAYPQNFESEKFLKKLEVKKVINCGNLKFSQTLSPDLINLSKSFLNSIKKRLVFCASSTHPGEEKIIMKAHLSLKEKYKNLLTIIIPRHIERLENILIDLDKLKMNYVIRTSNKKIDDDTEIYLVDTYGETKKFLNISKVAFIGGSVIAHGGQNPIEAARFNLKILHGPNTDNFKDIYTFFDKLKITYKFINLKQLIQISGKLLSTNKKKKIDFKKMGRAILKKNLKEINKILYNELKKT